MDALKKIVNEDTAAIVVQYPNFFGLVDDISDVSTMAHDAGALLISTTPEPTSLGILRPPGKMGADIAVGEGLSFGLPVNFGGPTLGIFTTTQKYIRHMPGRVCGKTMDSKGRTSYALTLATREQHIRREKATSNICSNQALCATTAAIYLASFGKLGFYKLAAINASLAEYAKAELSSIKGVTLPFDGAIFNEFTIDVGRSANDVIDSLRAYGINGGISLEKWYPKYKTRMLICTTEINQRTDIDIFKSKLQKILD